VFGTKLLVAGAANGHRALRFQTESNTIPVEIKKAIITAASKSQRTLPLQSLVDRDGLTKTALRIIIEEILSAGIDEAVVENRIGIFYISGEEHCLPDKGLEADLVLPGELDGFPFFPECREIPVFLRPPECREVIRERIEPDVHHL